MKKALPVTLLLVLMAFGLYAQEKNVSGQVTSVVDGLGLPGVNVVVKGTSVGTITDIDGKFALSVPEGGTHLVFSYIGYSSQEVEIGSTSSFNIELDEDAEQLDEVVVTAFGMKREQKSLGYSVQKVSGESVAEAKEVNVANALTGKIAGIQVSKTASGPAGSSKVIIRGNNSLAGNNQPLYVVDGMPIDNSNLNAAGRWGGIDYGDGIGDINSDDIDNISVLKGPNASALYGSRGANGVILITTKSGASKKGIGVEYNGTYTFEDVMITPDFQNEYGHGTKGKVPETAGANLLLGTSETNFASSWGPKMDGSSQMFYDGQKRAYTAQPDNYKDFWNTGTTATNTIALNGGNEDADFRVSYTNLTNKGIMPNATFDRNSVTARGRARLTNKLSTDVKLNYINSHAFNRPSLADIMENPVNGLLAVPRSVSIDQTKNYASAAGDHQFFTSNVFRLNPYWAVNKNQNEDTKNRIIAMGAVKYDFSDNYALELRSGVDEYTHKQKRWVAKGTPYRPDGEVVQNMYKVREQNTNLHFTFNHEFGDLSVNGLVGGNILDQGVSQLGYYGLNLMVDGLYNVSNATAQTSTEAAFNKQIWSTYAQLSLGYKNMLFLDVTGRNDMASSLTKPYDYAGSNNSYFYPSVTGSWAFSETFNTNSDILTFGKLRASWAEVGNDTDPYALELAYGAMGSHEGAYMFGIGPNQYQFVPNQVIPNQQLVPERTAATEVGVDVRFLKDRIGLDLTYYELLTKNQILDATVPSESGFGSKKINAGAVSNKGYEIMLRAMPVKTASGFEFEFIMNYAKNTNIVEELGELPQLVLGADRGVNIVAVPGQPYGDIYSFDYKRNDAGQILVSDDGYPLKTDKMVKIGNVQPDWTGGLTLNFRYKGFYLSTLFDTKQGGDIFSQSNRYLHLYGNHANTVEGRDAWANGTGGYVQQGIVESTGQPNTTAVDPQTYWQKMAQIDGSSDFIGTPFLYDASFVKWRELSVGYNVNPELLSKTPFHTVRFSIVGRNLAFLQNGLSGIDPEASFNNGNAGGRESGAYPSTRSVGFNLSLGL